MYIRLGAHLFSRKTLANVLLMLLLALSVFISNICIGILNRQFALLDSVQNFDKENTYIYTRNMRAFSMGEHTFEEEKKAILSDMKNVENNKDIDVEYIRKYSGDIAQKYFSVFGGIKYANCIGLEQKTSQLLNNNQLKSGQWFTDAEHIDGKINAVVLEGYYNVGDDINVTFYNLDVETDDNSIMSADVTFHVTGVLRSGSNMFEPNLSGGDADLTSIVPEEYLDLADGERAKLYFSTDDPQVQESLQDMTLSESAILYLNSDNPSAGAYSDIQNLNKTGTFINLKTASDNTYSYIYEQIMPYVPFLFGAFLLTVVCIICIMTLNSIDHMKTYAVYYLCGMNRSDMKKILFSYSLILILGSCVILSILSLITILSGDIFGIIVLNANNVYITLGLLALIVLIMVLVPYIMLKNLSPKDALRERK